MRSVTRTARIAAGSILLALGLYILLALPGVLADQDSTVPVRASQAARQ